MSEYGNAVVLYYLNGLLSNVLEKYSKTHFTHCYAHGINLIIQRYQNVTKNFKMFFFSDLFPYLHVFSLLKKLKAFSKLMFKTTYFCYYTIQFYFLASSYCKKLPKKQLIGLF